MASNTSAVISGTNNTANASTSGQALAQPPAAPELDLGHGIYIQDEEEDLLFEMWLGLPGHVQAARRAGFGDAYPELSPAEKAKLAENMTAEREVRFSRLLRTLDIRQAEWQLAALRERMQEILEELKAEKEDAMGDFDAEDFKGMEREDGECDSGSDEAER